MVVVEVEDFAGALGIGGPGAADFGDELFAGGGGEGGAVAGPGAREGFEQRHTLAEAGGPVGEPDPAGLDGDPDAVEEFAGGQGEGFGCGERGVSLLLTEEVVGFAGEAGVTPAGFESGFAGGIVGEEMAGGAGCGSGFEEKFILGRVGVHRCLSRLWGIPLGGSFPGC